MKERDKEERKKEIKKETKKDKYQCISLKFAAVAFLILR